MAIIKANNQTISAITSLPAAISTGKVLQIQQVQTSTDTTISGTTWTDVGGLSIDVTPVSSTSKFFLSCDVAFRLSTTSSNNEPNSNLRFLKDGSALFTEVTWGGFSMRQESARTDTFLLVRDSRQFLDSSASHTAGISVNFKVQGVTEGSSEAISFNESNINSRFHVMEVEA